MISLTVQLDDAVPARIITKHINRKTLDLINWYSAVNKLSKYLPVGFSDKEAEEVMLSLVSMINSQDVLELKDNRMQFALSCILEEEERNTDIRQELSAAFQDEDRRELERYLPEEAIAYYEYYDHFRDLLLQDNNYLDLTMLEC